MTIIIKPTYACNLRCKYCYLSNETKKKVLAFDIDFAKHIVSEIKQVLVSRHKKKVSIIWHGGEPLLWGVDNFQQIFQFAEKELSDFEVKHLLQTNLTLINREYIDLFKQYDVHVGFSLDGFKQINDSQRIFADGRGSFDVIMEKLCLCRENGLNLGCIVVGSKKHIGHIPELYEFMAENNMSFKFNPLFTSGEAERNADEYSVTPKEYADMAIELFDLWFNDTEHKVTETNFVEIASNIATKRTSGCMFGRNCQDNFLAITPTGDVMPCGRFCDNDTKQYSYGNLREESLENILAKVKTTEIYKRYTYIENSDCSKCKFFEICHGGCLHDGFLKSGDFKEKTFLCPAYKRIFAHIQKSLQEVNLLNKKL